MITFVENTKIVGEYNLIVFYLYSKLLYFLAGEIG